MKMSPNNFKMYWTTNTKYYLNTTLTECTNTVLTIKAFLYNFFVIVYPIFITITINCPINNTEFQCTTKN